MGLNEDLSDRENIGSVAANAQCPSGKAQNATCKGCYALLSACGHCTRCHQERAEMRWEGHVPTHEEEALQFWRDKTRVDCARVLDAAIAARKKGSWLKAAPAVPGFYWYRDSGGLYVTVAYEVVGTIGLLFEIQGIGDKLDAVDMARHNGEFWSEKLEEPR